MDKSREEERSTDQADSESQLLWRVLHRPVTLRAWLSQEQRTEHGIHVFDLGHPWVARLFGLPWLLVGGYATLGFVSRVIEAPDPGYFATSGWGFGVALLLAVFIPLLFVGIALVFGFSRVAVDPDEKLIRKLWGVWKPLRHRQLSLNKSAKVGAGWTDRGGFYRVGLGSTVLAHIRTESTAQLYALRAARRLALPLGDRTALEMTQSLQERLVKAHAKRRYPKPGQMPELSISEDASGITILAPPKGGIGVSVAVMLGLTVGFVYLGILMQEMEGAEFLWLPVMVLVGITVYTLRDLLRRLTATVIALGDNTIAISECIGARTLRSQEFRNNELDDLKTKKEAIRGHGPSGIALVSPVAMMRFGQGLKSAQKSFVVRVLRHHIIGSLADYPPIFGN